MAALHTDLIERVNDLLNDSTPPRMLPPLLMPFSLTVAFVGRDSLYPLVGPHATGTRRFRQQAMRGTCSSIRRFYLAWVVEGRDRFCHGPVARYLRSCCLGCLRVA